MEIDLYHLNAFTKRLFSGNPAAVCLLENWLPDDILQAIATENNLPATAFLVPRGGNYHIRWFTSRTEIDLCGHATLAAGHVVLHELDPKRNGVVFQSASGELVVTPGENGCLEMDLPSLSFSTCEAPHTLFDALNIHSTETYRAKGYIVILDSEHHVRDINPDFYKLLKVDAEAVIITARGDHVDYVSRYFAPKIGVEEDPVTGSAHCVLTPFWAERLGKMQLHAKQLSKRMGNIYCELKGDRVILKGEVVSFFKGKITLLS